MNISYACNVCKREVHFKCINMIKNCDSNLDNEKAWKTAKICQKTLFVFVAYL